MTEGLSECSTGEWEACRTGGHHWLEPARKRSWGKWSLGMVGGERTFREDGVAHIKEVGA